MTTRLACLIVSLICTSAGFAQSSQPAISSDVRAKLDAIEMEVARRRQTDPRAAEMLARELVKVLDLLAGEGDKPKRAELHVIGLYAPKHWRTNEVVEVTITDRPIVLALSAYEAVRWEIKLADGAKVERVLVGGYEAQNVIWSDSNEAVAPLPPVDVYTHADKAPNYFYAHDRATEQFATLNDSLKQLTDSDITTFQGAYYGTGGNPPHIVGPASAAWQAEMIGSRLDPLFREATAMSRARLVSGVEAERFTAIHYATDPPAPRVLPNGRQLPQRPLDAHSMPGMRGEFTVDGPIAETLAPLPQGVEQIAIDPQNKICYGITNHEVFRMDPTSAKRVNIPVRGDVPRMSWLCAAAFDTKRQRLVVAARTHAQVCAYSPAKDAWSFVTESDEAMPFFREGMTYCAEEDCFYALESGLREREKWRICRIDPQGARLDAVELDLTLPRGEGPARQRQLAVLDGGKKFAILIAPKPIGPQRVEPARCIVVDAKRGKVFSESVLRRPIVAPTADFEAAEADRLWRLLGSADATEAERAAKRLCAGRETAVAALKPRLAIAVAEALSAEQIALLVKQLGDSQEALRERATSDLIQAGPAMADALRDAMKQPDLPTETQARLRLIFDDISTPAAKERRDVRLIAVLQEIATPAAVEQLITLSAGAPDSATTKAARGALRQL